MKICFNCLKHYGLFSNPIFANTSPTYVLKDDVAFLVDNFEFYGCPWILRHLNYSSRLETFQLQELNICKDQILHHQMKIYFNCRNHYGPFSNPIFVNTSPTYTLENSVAFMVVNFSLLRSINFETFELTKTKFDK